MPLHRRPTRALARAAAPISCLLALLATPACDTARTLSGAPQATCTRCHGGELSQDGAPPRDLAGRSAGPAVGAHQAHLGRGVACGECHLVPTRVDSPGHLQPPAPPGATPGRALLTFGERAALGGLRPAYDRATATCTVYCHGATLGADGPAAPPRWGQGGPLGCGGCHGGPPASGAHRRHATRAPGLLAYGDVRVLEEVDPANEADQADYGFGCGACHPLAEGRHIDGAVQVELSPEGAPPGSLRARNAPGAAYDPATGRCSGVSCHSSGQAEPAFVASPPWTGGPDPAGCQGCHGNPPMYPNGGPGSGAANGHLALEYPEIGVNSQSWGHVRTSHAMPHGGEDDGFGWGRPPRGSPRTCQACHYQTVDPANTAPGGFFYLDTSVRTLVSLNPNRTADTTLYECQKCHTGAPGAPPAGVGKVRPLRHVNGRRDVDFDPRTEVPPGFYAATAPPITPPVAPYFFSNAFYDFYSDMLPYMTPATVLSAPVGTVSFPLTEAVYEPATQSCRTVACHFAQSTPTSPPLRWGDPFKLPQGGCVSCH